MLPLRRLIAECRAWVGVFAAFSLLVGSGAAHRIAAARFARASSSIPLPRGTLAALPLTIADWKGADVPLDDVVIEISDTDDHLNRVYTRANGRQRVSLFVGYGVKMRDLMPHRPEVCYVGQGWTMLSTRRVELPMPDGNRFPCQVHNFQRGGLDPRRIMVLNYYIVDGRFAQDVSALRSKAWKFNSDVSYVAQVQIAAPDDATEKTDEAVVPAFAAQSAELIRRLLVEAVTRVGHGGQLTMEQSDGE